MFDNSCIDYQMSWSASKASYAGRWLFAAIFDFITTPIAVDLHFKNITTTSFEAVPFIAITEQEIQILCKLVPYR